MGLFYGVRQKPGCCCKQTAPLAARGPITEGFVEGQKLISGIVDSESATEYPEGFWDEMSTVHLTVRVPTVASRRAAEVAGRAETSSISPRGSRLKGRYFGLSIPDKGEVAQVDEGTRASVGKAINVSAIFAMILATHTPQCGETTRGRGPILDRIPAARRGVRRYRGPPSYQDAQAARNTRQVQRITTV
jgi:hypothetical protein